MPGKSAAWAYPTMLADEGNRRASRGLPRKIEIGEASAKKKRKRRKRQKA